MFATLARLLKQRSLLMTETPEPTERVEI